MKAHQSFFALLLVLILSNGCASTKTTQNDALIRITTTPTTASQPKLRIATVQYPIEGNQTLKTFLAKIERYVSEAHQRHADLIVFPELIALDAWPLASKESDTLLARQIAEKITPEFFTFVKTLSKKYKVAILAGSAPRQIEDKIRNTALLAFADGRTIMQDKLFLTSWERDVKWQAGERLEVFDTPWGRTAILICYDVEFPRISQALARVAPELLLVPSMTESKSGLERVRWSAQARAVEHHAYVVVSGTVGSPTTSWNHFGQNLLLSPRDTEFAKAPIIGKRGEASIVHGVLDFEKLRKSRATTKFYPAKEQLLETAR